MNNLSDEELEFIRKTKVKIESMDLFNQSNWTDKEKKYLISNPDKNFTEIANELNRSPGSVRAMASRLGIKKPRRQWSEENISKLIEYYANPDMSIKQIAEELGETRGLVQYQANKLGLKKATNTVWTIEQEELLRKLYCEEYKSIEHISKIIKKNASATKAKVARLNLKRDKAYLEEWEKEYLKQNYSNLDISINEIAEHLDRTVESTKYYASKLGLKRSSYYWTKEDEEQLKILYCNKNLEIKQIAKSLNKSDSSVKSKVKRLKLKRRLKKTNENQDNTGAIKSIE